MIMTFYAPTNSDKLSDHCIPDCMSFLTKGDWTGNACGQPGCASMDLTALACGHGVSPRIDSACQPRPSSRRVRRPHLASCPCAHAVRWVCRYREWRPSLDRLCGTSTTPQKEEG